MSGFAHPRREPPGADRRRSDVLKSLLVLISLTGACGSVLPAGLGAGDVPPPAELTQEWGCGTGFWVGNSEQTAALRLAYQGDEAPPVVVDLPHPDWDAVLVLGTDLFANWCDDVIEPDEPAPVEHWTLPVVDGRLRIVGDPPEPFTGGTLAVEADDLVVELPDGTNAEFGSIDITNTMWGFFAG